MALLSACSQQNTNSNTTANTVSSSQDNTALLQCEKGHADSCYAHGLRYSRGTGVKPDMSEALKYFHKACDGNVAVACSHIGFVHQTAKGVEKNYVIAAEYYEKGCRLGDIRGCNNAGWVYEQEDSPLYHAEKSLQMYQFACEKGDAMACQNTVNHYIRVHNNYLSALPFAEKSCNGNNKEGCRDVGFIHLFMLPTNSKENNAQKGLLYLQKACDLNEVMSCGTLGAAYATKDLDGVVQDLNLAQRYLDKACQLKDKESCFRSKLVPLMEKLSIYPTHEKSQNRHPINPEKKHGLHRLMENIQDKWRKIEKNYPFACAKDDSVPCQNTIKHENLSILENACNNHQKESCRDLGLVYFFSLPEKNPQKAIAYLKEACDLHDPMSCNTLGIIYIQKDLDGVVQDWSLAQKYLNQACQLRDIESCKQQELLPLYQAKQQFKNYQEVYQDFHQSLQNLQNTWQEMKEKQ
ncbi:MAG: sel1 repeat family protein [Neisseriaceae bacterium]|nr:sel1 repeat family protein [Neisseriaceae bacterium]